MTSTGDNAYCPVCNRTVSANRLYSLEHDIYYGDVPFYYSLEKAVCPYCNTSLYDPEAEKRNEESRRQAYMYALKMMED